MQGPWRGCLKKQMCTCSPGLAAKRGRIPPCRKWRPWKRPCWTSFGFMAPPTRSLVRMARSTMQSGGAATSSSMMMMRCVQRPWPLIWKPLAVFTCPRADVVKVTCETEVFNASTVKCAIRQRSGLVGLVHCKSDGCERETPVESTSAQLCPWCKDIAVICFLADIDLTEGAALRKQLDTARGHNLPEDIAALEGVRGLTGTRMALGSWSKGSTTPRRKATRKQKQWEYLEKPLEDVLEDPGSKECLESSSV